MKKHGNTRHGRSSKEYISSHRIKRWSVYSSWVNMRQRCTNSNNPDSKYYKGRGVKYCDRWDSFENFLQDMGEPPQGYTLDRIDNNGDYSPDNCRWASRFEQANNRRTVNCIEYKGVSKPIGIWAKELPINISSKNLYKRIFTRGWSVERAFTQPVR